MMFSSDVHSKPVSTRNRQPRYPLPLSLLCGLLLWLLGGIQDATAQIVPLKTWENTYGTTKDEFTYHVVMDYEGNVYTLGASSGTDRQTILLKYGPKSGTPLWTVLSPTSSLNYPVGLAVDNSNNVYVVSMTTPSAQAGPSTAIFKYRPNSSLHWSQIYEGYQPQSMALDTTGNLYISVGTFSSGVANEAFLLKYNPEGGLLWSKEIQGEKTMLTTLAATPNGGVIGIGYVGTTARCIQFSTHGDILWEKTAPGETFTSVAVDGAGNVLLLGTHPGTSAFNTRLVGYAPDGSQLYKDSLPNLEPFQIAVDRVTQRFSLVGRRWDTNEEISTVQKFRYLSGLAQEWRKDIALFGANVQMDGRGNVYFLGSDTANKELFLIAYNADGSPRWTNPYQHPIRFAYPLDFAVDRGGVIAIASSDAKSETFPYNREMLTLRLSQNTNATPQSFAMSAPFQANGQSIWTTGQGGFDYTYDLLKYSDYDWNVDNTYGGYYLGTGGDLRLKTNGGLGVKFRAYADGGSVNLDYPLSLSLTAPNRELLLTGQNFTLQSNWSPDQAAKLTTTPFDVGACLCADFDFLLDVGVRASLLGGTLFDTKIVNNLNFHYHDSLLDLKKLLGGELERSFSFNAFEGSVKVPQIVAQGSLQGGTTLSASDEDIFFTLQGNLLTLLAQLLGVANPPWHLSFSAEWAGLSLEAAFDALGLYLGTDLSLSQNFQFTPQPTVRLKDESNNTVATFKAGESVNLTIPNGIQRMTLTPYVTLDNTFHNQTYLSIDPFWELRLIHYAFSCTGWDGVDDWLYTYKDTIAKFPINIYDKTFPLAGFAEVKGTPFTIAVNNNPSPNITGLSLPGLRLFLYKQDEQAPELSSFQEFANGTTKLLLYGTGLPVDSASANGVEVWLTLHGRTEQLNFDWVDGNTLQIQIPNLYRLLPGTGQVYVRRKSPSAQSNSINLAIEFPTPQLGTVGPNLWASDPLFTNTPLTLTDAGEADGSDTFIARRDYYTRLRDTFWPTLNRGTMASYFPNFNLNAPPALPTIVFDGKPLPRYDEPNPSGLLFGVLPPSNFDACKVVQVFLISPGPGGGESNTVLHSVAAPQPEITEISPSTIARTSGTRLLIVRGPANIGTQGGSIVRSNFNASSVVRWNGEDLPTQFFSSSELHVKLNESRFLNGGNVQITVFTPSNGTSYLHSENLTQVPSGGTSNAKTLKIVNPEPTLRAFNVPASLSVQYLFQGQSTVVLNLLGTGFLPETQVYLDDKFHPAEVLSPQLIRLTLHRAEVPKARSYGFVVFNPTPGGGKSNLLSLTLTDETPIANLAGTALAFDGVNDWVEVPHNPALNAFPLTVSAWIRTTDTKGEIVGKYLSSSLNGWRLYLYQGGVGAYYFRNSSNYIWDGDKFSFLTPPINDGQWHHVVFTVGQQQGRIYVDGVQRVSRSWTGTPGAPTTTQNLALGRYVGDNAYYLSGELDHVQIWNTVLSPTQIKENMFASNFNLSASPVAVFGLNEGSATTTHAEFLNTEGTLKGGTAWTLSTAPLDTFWGRYGEGREVTLYAYDPQGKSLTATTTTPTNGVLTGANFKPTFTATDTLDGTFTFHANNGTADSNLFTVKTRVTGSPSLMTVSGHIFLGDIVPEAAAQEITLEFRPTDNSGNFTRKVLVRPDGAFDLKDIPQKAGYAIAAQGAKWLRKVGAVGASGTGLEITLVAGDSNHDNAVNIFDLGTLANDFNSGPTDLNWNGGRADFNCDNSVDIFDLAILAQNFNTEGDL